jgi:hypothetical protein
MEKDKYRSVFMMETADLFSRFHFFAFFYREKYAKIIKAILAQKNFGEL